MEKQSFSQPVINISSLKKQLHSEQQLFDHIKQTNGSFGELKEIHLRIREIEKRIEAATANTNFSNQKGSL